MPPESVTEQRSSSVPALPKLGRVAFLTNFIPPYRKPVLEALARRCEHLKVLVSTPMESNRAWRVDWGRLDVQAQKTFTLKQRWRHARVGSEAVSVHVPLDTLPALAAFRPDLLISVEMGMRTAFAACYRRMHRQARLLVWADYAESTEKGRGFSRTILRRLLKSHPDGFIINGASGARYLQSLGVPAAKLHTVPYATDVARFGEFQSHQASTGPKRLLYVGQMIERKGLLPFLDALAQWALEYPAEQIEFTLAGDGPLRSRIADFPTPRNVSVRLLGNVPYEELQQVYQDSDIFVLPAFADTWGLVVNEAMAAGLPVLGSIRSQAVEELVQPGETGWLFDPEVASTLQLALRECLHTKEQQLAAMGQKAHTAATALSPDYTADLLVAAALRCRG